MGVVRSLGTFVLLLPFLLSYNCAYEYSLNELKSWCSQTPNPDQCEYDMSTSKTYKKPIKQKSDFFKLSVELALERARQGFNKTLSLGPKCRNAREKAAWADCLDLYELTINRISKSSTAKCTKVDAQTWLSTALTDLITCTYGFYDLGVTNYMLPLMSNNVTKLLSNALSLNKAPPSSSQATTSFKDGFPAWVKSHERKLLQATSSPASQANVVVAKDGSGKYTTLKAAVAAAPKSNKGRYIIYVKAGVYNEQVEIKGSNIMLVGDGIGKTIITGSKSVGGGTTTFRSATVGK